MFRALNTSDLDFEKKLNIHSTLVCIYLRATISAPFRSDANLKLSVHQTESGKWRVQQSSYSETWVTVVEDVLIGCVEACFPLIIVGLLYFAVSLARPVKIPSDVLAPPANFFVPYLKQSHTYGTRFMNI